ncbi:MAG: type II and III secretion system protein [Acidobacteria bacterium]|nr:type II and III secretion system protein [Acidobacteriota bacterium]
MPIVLAACLIAVSATPVAAEAGGQSAPARQTNLPAHKAFTRALKLFDAHKTLEALAELEEAARLAPENQEYATARETVRQQAVYEHLERGNRLLIEGRRVAALAEYRTALDLDPDNSFAKSQMESALVRLPPSAGDPERTAGSQTLKIVEESHEIRLQPQPGQRDIHYRGDSRGMLQEVAKAFGVRAVFDESVESRTVRFDLEGADFATAISLAGRMAHTFWTPLSGTEILVVRDTRENRRQFERMSLRTFYLPDVTSPEQMQELVGMLRTVLEVRLLQPHPGKSLLTVRAPQTQLDEATRFLEELSAGRPQVTLDVKVFEVRRSVLRNLGVELPLQYTIFNVPSEARQLLSAPGAGNLVDQLVASGGINQANAAAVAALLAQLQAAQASLFTQPFAVFGGGITLTGITLPPGTANFLRDASAVQSLEHATLRAAQGDPAIMRIGTRFPILNATFAPILNSPQLTAVIQNQSFAPPVPSFTFEDLGLNLKVTPRVQGQNVLLDLELNIRALGERSFNGIPVLSNREYKGSVTVASGETAAVAGFVSESEQKTLRGIPGVARVPLLGWATSSRRKESSENQLLVLVTPFIVRGSRSPDLSPPPGQ